MFQAKTPLDQNQALHLSELVVALRREVQQTTSAPVLELGAVDERKKLVVDDIDHWLQLVMEADTLGWMILPRICPRPGMQSATPPCRGA